MQLSDWLLVEVALLLIGLTHITFEKKQFDPLGIDQSSFRLPARGLESVELQKMPLRHSGL
jgi:hypothetical protein